MRKQAAALQIQKSYRCYVAWNSYSKLRSSAITLQAGLRVFGAYKELISENKIKPLFVSR